MKLPSGLVIFTLGAATLCGAPSWNTLLKQSADWYATAEARAVAESVMRFQTESGGWPKNTDMSVPPSASFLTSEKKDVRAATIDNDGTTYPLQILARIHTANPAPHTRAAIERGIDYLLEAQYENGGWPQYYPLQKGYYTHITFNDGAMIKVLELLRAVSRGESPWDGIDPTRRNQASRAVERGIDCILKTQVKVDGALTVWCAQHDEITLAPASARNYEIISLSGSESVGIVRFLMEIENPSRKVRQAIDAAMAWFAITRIPDQKIIRAPIEIDGKQQRDQAVTDDPAGPGIWARFYEIGTNRPIFAGRDQTIHFSLTEVEIERRSGYAYYGTWPMNLLTKNYPSWQKRNGTTKTAP